MKPGNLFLRGFRKKMKRVFCQNLNKRNSGSLMKRLQMFFFRKSGKTERRGEEIGEDESLEITKSVFLFFRQP